MKTTGIILSTFLLTLSAVASSVVGDTVSCWGEFDAPNGHHKVKYDFYIGHEKNPNPDGTTYRPVKIVDALLDIQNPNPLLLKDGTVEYLNEEFRSTDKLKRIVFKDDDARTETTFEFDYTGMCLTRKSGGSGVHWRYSGVANRSGRQAEGTFKTTCISLWAVDLYDQRQACAGETL